MEKINLKMIKNAPELIRQWRFSHLEFENGGIENLQRRRKMLLDGILKYATEHVEYYQNIKGDIILENFPIVDKDIIRSNFDRFVSDEKNRIYYREARTGGSTGQPFGFYNSMFADGEYQQKFWNRLGYEKGDKILAIDGSKVPEEKLSAGEYWVETPRNHPGYGRYHLSTLYLDKINICTYIKYIQELRPSFIRSFAWCLYTLAHYIVENNISLTFHIKAVQVTAEVCFPYQVEEIEKAFSCKLYMQYGHTETSIFGYTYDSSFKYILEPMYGHMEVVDKDGKQVKPGETGEIVVTGYWNKIMPLIRYKTGDLAEYGGESEKGTIINKVYGRTQDYVVRRDNVPISITSIIMAGHFKALASIERWQIEQWEPGKIKISIIKAASYSKVDEQEVYDAFKSIAGIETTFEYVSDIPLTERGKSKLLVQHICY